MIFKRSWISTLKNIHYIERAVKVALYIFFHVKLLMCLTSALERFQWTVSYEESMHYLAPPTQRISLEIMRFL